MEIDKIYQGDCLKIMKTFPDNSIDLVVTSPPYNCGIKYDVYNDAQESLDYFIFAQNWLTAIFRILKDTGRIALNLPYEINMKERGGRIFMLSEYWQIMKQTGFKFAGLVDLAEIRPHRVKYTAWGSYLSASAPYIYNAKEGIIIAYKNNWKKGKGKSTLTKEEFIESVSGMWKYRAETKKITEANFSLSLPTKAIRILSFENDIILDPFLGSGTTAIACKFLKRHYIGIEISSKYCGLAQRRIDNISLLPFKEV